MGKKQQASPPSETFVAAAGLPAAAEILAGELVSVVARSQLITARGAATAIPMMSRAWSGGG